MHESISKSITPANVRESYLWVLGVGWGLIQLYAGLSYFELFRLTYIHVLMGLSMAFALNPTSRKVLGTWGGRLIDAILVLTPITTLGYMLLNHTRITGRIPLIDPVTGVDLILGLATIVLLLEAARRTVGLTLAAIVAAFLAYGLFGSELAGPLSHSGMTIKSLVDLLFLQSAGIWGTPAKISAKYVYLFILFGAILLQSGADDLFLDLAKSLGGRFNGGSAKIAVVGSTMMGTINGSAVANTVSTGSVTIPLMQRSGYDDESAGAIEAFASSGGQILPPLMGAAAFIMANISGIPYFEIILYAAVPAVLFYVCVYASVHFEALKQGIGRLPPAEIPSAVDAGRAVLHLVLPIAGMMYVFVTVGNVVMAATVLVILTYLVVALRGSTRLGIRGYVWTLRRASEMVISAAIPTALAGIIVGVLYNTGIASRLTVLALDLTGGLLVLTLILVALVSIVLGLGMPTSGAYITVAVLAVPTLLELGLPRISAHLFALYFAVLSMITPPIAIAAFAAASISGGNAVTTALRAFKMALPVYTLPFFFVYYDELLTLSGDPVYVGVVILVVATLLVLLSAAGVGYLLTDLRRDERLAIAAAIVIAAVNAPTPVIYLVPVLLAVGLRSQARPGVALLRRRLAENPLGS